MLQKLTLQNFKRHRDLTIDFTSGINCVRGGNEYGKSSVLHAIGYALFGSKSLNVSLDEAVTWGEPVSTLKVTLTLQLQGDTFTFARGKSGAEVLKNGVVFCTGQNEVTSLAAQLMGADTNVAGKLFLASQNGIRGALEEGPKALSVLIEDLSDMAIFDQILDSASEKLVLGSPALLEERQKGAEATLAAAMATLPTKPDDVDYQGKMKDLATKLMTTEASLPALEAKAATTDKEWVAASTLYVGRQKLEHAVETAAATLAAAKEQVAVLSPAACTVVTDSREALRAEIAEAEGFEKRVAAYATFCKLPDGERYAYPLATFTADAETNFAQHKHNETRVREAEKAIAAAKGRRINHDKCDKCGQDVTHLKHIVETNAAVDADLASLGLLLDEAKAAFDVEVVCANRFNSIRRFAATLQPEFMKLVGYVQFDSSVYPPLAVWDGEVPSASPDAGTARAALAKVEAEIKALAVAKARLELATEQHAKAEHAHAQAGQALAAYESPTSERILELTEIRDDAALYFGAAKGEIIIAKEEMTKLTTEYTSALSLWSACQRRIDDAQRVIAECQKDLGSLAFNNGLVKKLRSIRPIVANKVWNTVLASVSVMFSQMRDEASIVTKEASGFKVNGQAVESLSGSTLDVLGIALRCSLLRTFIPQCGLLVLDEPAQGCDATRTESMLGFLQSLGMGQTLLVTHESISESISSNVIQL